MHGPDAHLIVWILHLGSFSTSAIIFPTSGPSWFFRRLQNGEGINEGVNMLTRPRSTHAEGMAKQVLT